MRWLKHSYDDTDADAAYQHHEHPTQVLYGQGVGRFLFLVVTRLVDVHFRPPLAVQLFDDLFVL